MITHGVRCRRCIGPNRIECRRSIYCVASSGGIIGRCGRAIGSPPQEGVMGSCGDRSRKGQGYTLCFGLTCRSTGTAIGIIRDGIGCRRRVFPNCIQHRGRISRVGSACCIHCARRCAEHTPTQEGIIWPSGLSCGQSQRDSVSFELTHRSPRTAIIIEINGVEYGSVQLPYGIQGNGSIGRIGSARGISRSCGSTVGSPPHKGVPASRGFDRG